MPTKHSGGGASKVVARVLGSLSTRADHEARLDALALAADELDVLAATFAAGWGATFEGLTVERGRVTGITLTPTGHKRTTPPLAGPLRQLPALRALVVSGYVGRSAEVEPGFFSMPALESLEISHLAKGSIPPELADLATLRALTVTSCRLKGLDAGSLPRGLTTLGLEFQDFTAAPEAVFELAALERLSLEDNKIARDAGAWERLTSLKTLSLASNRLKAIPHLLASPLLRRLERLDLARNPQLVVSEATRASLGGVQIIGAYAPAP
jgi:hypothetical protein